MKKNILLLLVLFRLLPLSGQTVLEGKIISSENSPISNVLITISKLRNQGIIGFSITNSEGLYKLIINSKDDSLLFKVSLFGYKHIEIIILNNSAKNNYTLSHEENILKEVIVKNNPIRLSKDTINYSVKSFATKDDRSIADVIKKLPGMEVGDDGRILFQGKGIQAFLVNGMDLLEGRYSLASNNLPHDAVKDVQIIENDQRIKVLDSLIPSNGTTLNIKLKRFLTTGTGNIGIGASPTLWDINLTPITFNKSFQAINSYQTNNVGKDNTSQLNILTLDNIFPINNKSVGILNIQPLTTPPFDTQYWLDNNMHLLSSNILKVVKKDVQIKLNVSFTNDFQQRTGNTTTNYAIQGQNISVIETSHNGINKDNLKAGLVIEKNIPSVYFKDVMNFEREWASANNFLKNSYNPIYEGLGNTPVLISNKLGIIKAVGKQLLSINSMISYSTLSQTLSVLPGQFDSSFNNNIPYDQVQQIFNTRSFQTSNYAGIVKGYRHFSIAPRIGIETQFQTLESSIYLFDSTTKISLGNGYVNNLSLLKTKVYTELGMQLKKNGFESSLILNISHQQYNLKDNQTNQNTRTERLLFEPVFSQRINFIKNYDFTIFSTVKNSFGEISQLYTGYILQSYRTLQKLSPTLPESVTFSNGLNLNFKNPLKSFFYNVGYSISSAKRNLIFKNNVNKDGSLTLESVLRNNFSKSQLINGSIGKYFGQIKTVVKLSANWGLNRSEQMINNAFQTINGITSGWGINLTNSLFTHLNIDYDVNISYSLNKLDDQKINSIKYQKHNLKVNIFPLQNHMISMNLKYYYNSENLSANKAFINLLYRLTIPKRKIDFEGSCTNLFNTKYFSTVYTDGFQTIQNTLTMRPRQFLISVKYSF